ncbi:MAG: chromosomal replication initiator protein DnaA [Oscillospiraceae bacterium]
MQSFNDVWDIVKTLIKESNKISNVAFDMWIGCIEPLNLEADKVVLFVPSSFQKNIILEKYSPIIKECFFNVLGFEITLDFMIKKEEPENVQQDFSENDNLIERTMRLNGEYEYTFDTFIVGSSNKFAHAASLAVASNPSGAYNPLFIYGPSGLGKTHLLYAICNEVRHSEPNKNMIYVKGEEFTNELIEAIGKKSTIEFHNKYRAADILLVDDIQFIGGKESTQEEFFHTFNTLYHDGKQIVLTSDRPPKEIKTLEDRLRTRFEWGLLADIQTPDFETRIAIIRRKAQLLGIKINDDVSEYIANKLKNNIRQLEGAVKKLKAYYLLENLEPSIAVAQNAIKDILNDNQPVSITIDKVFNEISRTFNIDINDLKSSKQSATVSKARQVAVYVLVNVTDMTLNSIGEELGGRDHSTIVYAKNKIEKNMKIDKFLKETIDDIIKNIRT